jgi:hypothetical protein
MLITTLVLLSSLFGDSNNAPVSTDRPHFDDAKRDE